MKNNKIGNIWQVIIKYIFHIFIEKSKSKFPLSTKKVTKKEELLNLTLAESNEVKSLAFPVSLC